MTKELDRNSQVTSCGNHAKEQSTNFSEKHLDLFFIRLKAIYPNWSSGIKDKRQFDIVRNEWLSVLRKLTLNEIKCGLEECKIREDFPPSIAKFVKLSLGIKDFDAAPGNDFYMLKARVSSWDFHHMSIKEMDKAERANYRRITEEALTKRISIEFLEEEDENLLDSSEIQLLENDTIDENN